MVNYLQIRGKAGHPPPGVVEASNGPLQTLNDLETDSFDGITTGDES
jgi:hypothetical protein